MSSMGSGRDKRKKQKGKQPGLGASKTEKKTALNATKEQRRAEKSAAVSQRPLAMHNTDFVQHSRN